MQAPLVRISIIKNVDYRALLVQVLVLSLGWTKAAHRNFAIYDLLCSDGFSLT